MSDLRDTMPVYDVIGVGFGPSNLALAIAVQERDDLTAVFLERRAEFGWHRGMLLRDATMQVAFLKDLVTLRNPASPFSFVCYLHERGRLLDFINHKSFFPLRVEFHDYLEWVAARLDHLVRYGSEVIGVEPVHDGDAVVALDVSVRRGGTLSVLRTRNLVLATGLEPVLPATVRPSGRVWHSADLLGNVAGLTAEPRRCVVVGAGQSAAEVTAFLHDRFPAAEVCAVFARYGYSPADDTPFANRIFDPAAVEAYFGAPAEVKAMLVNYHANTNYSVVDADLIGELYQRVYREKVLGAERLRMHNVSRLTGVRERADRVEVTVEALATGRREVLDADVVVCATGYRPADPFALLGPVGRYLATDELGRARVGRDYRWGGDDDLHAGIYLQGGTEHSHGITSSLLSNVAVRAGEIVAAIAARRTAHELIPD
ncbi:lysine N(6)-hydroxylase/L-ornithine N(5)-oxygenase family protein [Actinoplanes sp. L3-i22]|uniref:lysine N(6)-hydroxylase/L-ornithine N(5)-oxygenase family protein n=1 Tax=Actinoplanes sp. L3-i22 TaxID=2836373 RepID=UPI001C76F5FE|nr:lysine N(6)-hydroxylase/L-ornithine N(5)-oxygenase family protein [Actinoplanes sp. L3-i22]BCY11526.1 lysine/ornithine N-monooxygenase [Actinoplanes sp. L3-i22]